MRKEKPMPNIKSQRFKTVGILLALSAVLAVFTATAVLAADSYPSKPVRLIIPFPPGGGNDIIGRLIATQLTEKLGKQVVVENRGGAGGIVGTEAAAHSQPDGYTLLMISPTYTVTTSTHGKLPYDPVKSFVPVAKLASSPAVLVVFPGLPVKSVKELIALAKEKPGKLICAASGSGAWPHLIAELFFLMADIDVVTVQFKGVGPALIDTVGGHSQIHFASLTPVMPHIKSGKLKALGVCDLKRSAMFPDVPTISEAGVPGYETSGWWGIVAPAGTPQAIVDRLNKELSAILASAELQKLLLTQGAKVDHLGPAEFGKLIESETAKWVLVVKKANIKPE